MTKIVIIGAGQLGSRHLQALNLLDFESEITVVDSNPESLGIASSRFNESIKQINHAVNYHSALPALKEVDIVIVASTAQNRRQIIENLLAHTDVRYLILEKLLFTQKQDYLDIAELFSSRKTKVWVNCPMRMMAFYGKLNQLFQNQTLQYQVSGCQYGLVTNAIHYLDHLAFINGVNQFSLDCHYLDKTIIASKRPGYFELTGTLIANFADGSMAHIQCDKAGNAPIQIEIYSHKNRIISREWEQKAWQTSLDTDWQWREVEAAIPFQSTLTADLVSSLIKDNYCQLPDYETSMQTHLQMLEPLRGFLRAQGIDNGIDYPFT